jgi:hypothetical protein
MSTSVMISVDWSSTDVAFMLCLVASKATRARKPPLADADGQPRCDAAKLRASSGRA